MRLLDIFSGVGVYARPHPGPLPEERESTSRHSKILIFMAVTDSVSLAVRHKITQPIAWLKARRTIPPLLGRGRGEGGHITSPAENIKEAEMKSPLHILHLEDNPNDAALVQSTLAADGITCATICVQTHDDFVAALERGGIDLILSDFTLPAFDGLAALSIAHTGWPDLPVIMVSGTLGEERAVDFAQERCDGLCPEGTPHPARSGGAPRHAGSRNARRKQAARGAVYRRAKNGSDRPARRRRGP